MYILGSYADVACEKGTHQRPQGAHEHEAGL